MNGDDFIEKLGHTFDEKPIQTWLASLGIKTKSPKLYSGTAFLTSKKAGLDVIFGQPEALDVTRKYKKGVLVLTGVTMYGDKVGDRATYAGTLPLGLAFGDTTKKVEKVLGKPADLTKYHGQ